MSVGESERERVCVGVGVRAYTVQWSLISLSKKLYVRAQTGKSRQQHLANEDHDDDMITHLWRGIRQRCVWTSIKSEKVVRWYVALLR